MSGFIASLEIRAIDMEDALARADDQILVAVVHALLSDRLRSAQRRATRNRMSEALLHNAIVQVNRLAQRVFLSNDEQRKYDRAVTFTGEAAKMWHEIELEMSKTLGRTVELRDLTTP